MIESDLILHRLKTIRMHLQMMSDGALTKPADFKEVSRRLTEKLDGLMKAIKEQSEESSADKCHDVRASPKVKSKEVS